MNAPNDVLDAVVTDEEAEMAKVAQRCLLQALDHSRAQKIKIIDESNSDEMPTLELPAKALRLFADLLGAMGQRQVIALVLRGHALTTQDAAAFLNVSRPYVIKLIDEGKLTCHKIGRHRRIEFDVLQEYRREMKRDSAEALQALTDEDQALNMGY